MNKILETPTERASKEFEWHFSVVILIGNWAHVILPWQCLCDGTYGIFLKFQLDS